MLSESFDAEDETIRSRSSGHHQRRHKSNGILRHEPGSQAEPIIQAPTIVNNHSSKQVSFVQTKNGKRSSKVKESRPKMMNLDPSTHFANELDEFRHIEGEVEKDVIDFTDQDSEDAD
jgi:hypothetical protein